MDEIEEYMQTNHKINMTALYRDHGCQISSRHSQESEYHERPRQLQPNSASPRKVITSIYMDSSAILVNSSTSRSRYMLLLLLPLPRLLRSMHNMPLHQSLQMHTIT